MRTSTFVTSVVCNDPNQPGCTIDLSVHQIDGGYIGIDSNYIDEVANYIVNPYQSTQIIKLCDNSSYDEASDPSTDEDTFYGFLKLLSAVDVALLKSSRYDRELVLSDLETMSGIRVDQIQVLLGIAKQTLDEMEIDDASGEN